jgi:hypothetical protein
MGIRCKLFTTGITENVPSHTYSIHNNEVYTRNHKNGFSHVNMGTLLEEGTKTKWVITGEAMMQNNEYGRKDGGVLNKTRFYHINGHLRADTQQKFLLIHYP